MPKDFFQRAHPLWYVPCDGGLLYLALLTFCPDRLPYEPLGWFGKFTNYLAYQQHSLLLIIFVSAVFVHIYESFLARQICQKLKLSRSATRSWIVQTMLLGYPSLGILKRYSEKNQR